jgi:hypothetical protein
MLKIIKSKAFKVAGLVMALAFMVTAVSTASAMTTMTTTTTVNASAYNYSGVMKSGSKGPGVATLQAALNSVNSTTIIVDSSFGPATKSAVMQFQAAHGLTADGVVGPMTGAALSAATVAVITVPSTGALCPNGMTLASNCMSGAMTPPTGALCPNGMTLASNCMTGAMTPPTPVAGCTAGAMFNSMTAAPCVNNTPVVTGGAGNISSIITLGSPSSVTASEGDTGRGILGVEIKADSGSNLAISNFGVKFSKTAGSGSTWMSRYINKVSVMQGSTVIGSISASQLSQNGNDYVANIPVTGASVAANQRAQYYLAVDVNSNVDSNDSGSTITATITSVRYSDGTGIVLSLGAINNQTFTVQKLSSNANVKLQVSEDATNPRNRTVTANYTTTTTDVSLLKFNITANGSAMNLNEVDVIATANDTLLNEVTKAAKLYKLRYTLNGQVNTATVNFVSGLSGSTARVIKFGDTTTTNSAIYTANSLNGGGSLMIPLGQTMSFEVLADILPIASSGTTASAFEAGDVLKVDLPSVVLRNGTTVAAAVTGGTSNAVLTTGADGSIPAGTNGVAGITGCASSVAVCWSVLDQNGNSISTSTTNRQGSASGYEATFRVQGLSSTLATTAPVVVNQYNNSGALTTSTVSMDVAVNAAGSDFFLPRVVGIGTSGTDTTVGTNGFLIVPLNNAYAFSTPVTSTAISATVSAVSGATVDGSGKFKIASGATAVFRIVATVANGSTPVAGSRYVQLNAVGGALDSASAPTAFSTTPASSFQSAGTAAF